MSACPVCDFPTTWHVDHSPAAVARCTSCGAGLHLFERSGPTAGLDRVA